MNDILQDVPEVCRAGHDYRWKETSARPLMSTIATVMGTVQVGVRTVDIFYCTRCLAYREVAGRE